MGALLVTALQSPLVGPACLLGLTLIALWVIGASLPGIFGREP